MKDTNGLRLSRATDFFSGFGGWRPPSARFARTHASKVVKAPRPDRRSLRTLTGIAHRRPGIVGWRRRGLWRGVSSPMTAAAAGCAPHPRDPHGPSGPAPPFGGRAAAGPHQRGSGAPCGPFLVPPSGLRPLVRARWLVLPPPHEASSGGAFAAAATSGGALVPSGSKVCSGSCAKRVLRTLLSAICRFARLKPERRDDGLEHEPSKRRFWLCFNIY